MIKLLDIKKLKIERQALRTSLFLMVMALFLLKIGYQPYQKRLEEKKKLYLELREVLIQKRLILEQRGNLTEQSFNVTSSQNSKILNELFPKGEDEFLIQIMIAKDLRDRAEKKGLKIEGMDLISFITGKRLLEIPFYIRIRGPVKQTLEYLEEVQNYFNEKGKFFKISELTFSESGNELSLTLRISVFKSEI